MEVPHCPLKIAITSNTRMSRDLHVYISTCTFHMVHYEYEIMLGYSQLDRIQVIFVNEAKYQRNVHRCHIMFVRQTNQYLKDKRKSFTLQFTPCQFRSHIPSVMPRKSSIRVLSGIDDAFHKRRNYSHQCGCTIRNDFMYIN